MTSLTVVSGGIYIDVSTEFKKYHFVPLFQSNVEPEVTSVRMAGAYLAKSVTSNLRVVSFRASDVLWEEQREVEALASLLNAVRFKRQCHDVLVHVCLIVFFFVNRCGTF